MERNIENHIAEGKALLLQHDKFDLRHCDLQQLYNSGNDYNKMINSFYVGLAIGARIMKNEQKKRALQK